MHTQVLLARPACLPQSATRLRAVPLEPQHAARLKLRVCLQGTHLASGSGDMCVKLWSFAKQKCMATFKGHTHPVWGVAWHSQGDFLASCSMDQTVRLWDFATGRVRQILRSAAFSLLPGMCSGASCESSVGLHCASC